MLRSWHRKTRRFDVEAKRNKSSAENQRMQTTSIRSKIGSGSKTVAESFLFFALTALDQLGTVCPHFNLKFTK